ncbi:MAG TPA: divalent-cation tolerance protein CutA [Thermoanaerobaculia bacterium]|jgi:periplasmic divalent cation tolerance protein|nr:divalent-cation tolerance protein CutA [Thermoanaerobaculia bacterium]
MKSVMILTSVGADFDARALAHALVEARLAACVNIVPAIHSVYRWEGRVTDDTEQLLIIKTSESRVDELRTELLARHPYEVPEFVVMAIETSEAYGAWIAESVRHLSS